MELHTISIFGSQIISEKGWTLVRNRLSMPDFDGTRLSTRITSGVFGQTDGVVADGFYRSATATLMRDKKPLSNSGTVLIALLVSGYVILPEPFRQIRALKFHASIGGTGRKELHLCILAIPKTERFSIEAMNIFGSRSSYGAWYAPNGFVVRMRENVVTTRKTLWQRFLRPFSCR